MAKKKVKHKVPSAKAARAAGVDDIDNEDGPLKQGIIEDAFPDMDDELEELALTLCELDDKSKKANEKKAEKQREICLRMKDLELEAYKCYHCRKELRVNVEAAKMRTIPEKESTPYTPAA